MRSSGTLEYNNMHSRHAISSRRSARITSICEIVGSLGKAELPHAVMPQAIPALGDVERSRNRAHSPRRSGRPERMRVLLTPLGRRFGLARRPLAQNDAGGALGEGKRRRAELAAGQGGQHRRVHHTQPARAPHAQRGVDDGERVRPHATGAAERVGRVRRRADVLVEGGVVAEVDARPRLLAPHAVESGLRDELAREAQPLPQRRQVRLRGAVPGLDARRRGRVGGAERDRAPRGRSHRDAL
mmetsp:Transcript_32023/g.102472  ORF Transcript_32023/g.102472 Transcript_32023/m.102472 type:complete len:243 (-) Transcript_32023:633-1361(-)